MRLILALCLFATPVLAEDGGGTLNPEEMTIDRILSDVAAGEVSMMAGAAGYGMTRKGDHVQARAVFQACADAGYAGAMTWMSQLDNNGLGAPEDAVAAAAWDRQAAEAGDGPPPRPNVEQAGAGRGTRLDFVSRRKTSCAGPNRRSWKCAAAWKSTCTARPRMTSVRCSDPAAAGAGRCGGRWPAAVELRLPQLF